ncbi:glutaredoxin family protein [Sulfuricystis multivorans]|uniref:glutaredoxin family protein n=1 Tax=Sulfuricystis multivorans TaxID=2211108 RepID=UPI0015595C35|nr:glutaredoxin family protein [Sulfuricystis multivorans]
MKRIVLLWGLACVAIVAQAQYYRWVDEQGKVHYGDRPPPSLAGKAQVMRHGAPAPDRELPYAVREAMANFPVTLYVSADCGQGCRDGRDYLKQRGIPFTEKPVATKEDVEALKKLVGEDEAVVPVLAAGPKTVVGWRLADWQHLLDAAGYPKEKGR